MPAKYPCSANNKTILRGNSWLHIANLGELIFIFSNLFSSAQKIYFDNIVRNFL